MGLSLHKQSYLLVSSFVIRASHCWTSSRQSMFDWATLWVITLLMCSSTANWHSGYFTSIILMRRQFWPKWSGENEMWWHGVGETRWWSGQVLLGPGTGQWGLGRYKSQIPPPGWIGVCPHQDKLTGVNKHGGFVFVFMILFDCSASVS